MWLTMRGSSWVIYVGFAQSHSTESKRTEPVCERDTGITTGLAFCRATTPAIADVLGNEKTLTPYGGSQGQVALGMFCVAPARLVRDLRRKQEAFRLQWGAALVFFLGSCR